MYRAAQNNYVDRLIFCITCQKKGRMHFPLHMTYFKKTIGFLGAVRAVWNIRVVMS